MARRRYLVAYDIRDDRRLRAIAKFMEGYGLRIQYSVFISDLSDREKIAMRGDITTLMKASEDSVMIVDLGPAGDTSRFQFLGHHERLPSSDVVIVLPRGAVPCWLWPASDEVVSWLPVVARMQVRDGFRYLTSAQ